MNYARTNQPSGAGSVGGSRHLKAAATTRVTSFFFWSFSNIFSSNSEPRLAAPPPSFSALQLSITACPSSALYYTASSFRLLFFPFSSLKSRTGIPHRKFLTPSKLSLSLLSGRVLSFLSRFRSTVCYGYSDTLTLSSYILPNFTTRYTDLKMIVTPTVDMATMDYCVLKFKFPFRLSHTEIGAIDISETAAEIPLLPSFESSVMSSLPCHFP